MSEEGKAEEQEVHPDPEVLKHRYEEVLDEIDSRRESLEKEGEHSRRMVRITFVFLGVVVAALSAGPLQMTGSAMFADSACGLSLGGVCILTKHLVGVGIFLLAISTYLYLRGASGGLPLELPAPGNGDAAQNQESALKEFEIEADYFLHRIEDLETTLDNMHDLHNALYTNLWGATATLFLGFGMFVVVGYTSATGSPLNLIHLSILLVLFFGIVAFVEWRSPLPNIFIVLPKRILDFKRNS